jgi:hypothetical protein
MKARRAGTWLATARFTPAIRRRRHAITTAEHCEKEAEMTCDLLRERERTRRRILWALASLRPGDPTASELLSILDELDEQERSGTSYSENPLELSVRNSVSAKRHNSGIDIILERDIPQPWRERFLQASIGSTRVTDGPYATDWDKFLACWETEMQHLEEHRAARSKPKLD